MTHFDVSWHRASGALVVVPEGELDIASVEAMRAALRARAPEEGVVIDLRALEFLDTSGIQLLLEARRSALEEGFALRVWRGRPIVQRIFEVAGLEGVLPFEDAPG